MVKAQCMSESVFRRMMEEKEAEKASEHHIQEIAAGTYRALKKEQADLREQKAREDACIEREATHKKARDRAFELVKMFFESKGFGGDGFKLLSELEFQQAYMEFNARVKRKQKEIRRAILLNSVKKGVRTVVVLLAIPFIAGLLGLDLLSLLFGLLDCVLVPGVIFKTMFFRVGDEHQEADLAAYKQALDFAKRTRKKLEAGRAGDILPGSDLSI